MWKKTFGVAPRVGDKDSHALVWPLELGLRTPMLRCGPSSWVLHGAPSRVQSLSHQTQSLIRSTNVCLPTSCSWCKFCSTFSPSFLLSPVLATPLSKDISFFSPSSGNQYKNHLSHHSSIALPMPEVPKVSMGAICFTSSDSNGGCWVVLVIFLVVLFCSKKKVFLFHARPTSPKKVHATYT